MFRNNTTTIVLVSAIIVSAVSMGLGVLINTAISANAQVPNGTQQQSITDEQNTVAIQKTEVSVLKSMHPSDMFLCSEKPGHVKP